ncbi:MAG: hypothetical protein RI922_2700 [Bacteroidota bacterium]|jgi:hypothetical protein
MRILKKHWVFISLVLIGIIIRLIFMSYQGLSNDELSAWHRTHFSSWNDFWIQGVKVGDMHPAFYQVLLWCWIRIFGDSEIAIRSTSLVFYVLTSVLIYRIGIRHFSKFSGLLLIAFYTGLTFTVINTVFARPYNSGVFFLLLAFYGILELKVYQAKLWKWTLIISLGLIGAMLSHYFAFLVALVLSGLGLFYVGRKRLLYLMAAGVLAAVLFVPHMSITLFQVGRGGLGWLAAPKLSWPLDFIHLFFNDSWVIALSFSCLFLILLIASKRRWNTASTFSILVFVLTFCGAFVLSHLFTPILREIVMQFLLPFLFLPLFYLLEIQSRKLKAVVLSTLVIIPTGDSFLRNQLIEPVHFGVFKEIGAAINDANRDFGKENITFASNFNNIDYINYYVEEDLKETIIDWDQPAALDSLFIRAKNSKTKYFAYSFSNSFNVPMFFEVIRLYFPTVVRTVQTKYSIFVLFEKGNKERLFGTAVLKPQSKKMIETKDEFSFENRMTVGTLPEQSNKWKHYVLQCNAALIDTVSLYLTLTVDRNGEAWKKGEDLAVYYSYEFPKFSNNDSLKRMICPFILPDDILPSDELKFYIWNPSKGKFKASAIGVYFEELK